MKLFLAFALFILTLNSYGQKQRIYSQDFDYKNLIPKDTFVASSRLPNYYIVTTYFNNIITDLDLFLKEDWMQEPIQIHAKVQKANDATFFIYDGGKAKSGGYGRLFSKKVKFSDTAMLKNDTLVFKRTSPYSIHVDYAASIFSDSFYIDQKVFPIDKNNKPLVKTLSSFENYSDWNNIEGYSRYYQVLIAPKKEKVVQAKRLIEDGTIDYSFGYLHKQSYFQEKRMPISLLWIKHTGIIY